MDVPFAALKYVLNARNTDPQNPRYEPYGVFVAKKYGYQVGCRPVLYLSNAELNNVRVPQDELWRVLPQACRTPLKVADLWASLGDRRAMPRCCSDGWDHRRLESLRFLR
jgi:hypothetical protein